MFQVIIRRFLFLCFSQIFPVHLSLFPAHVLCVTIVSRYHLHRYLFRCIKVVMPISKILTEIVLWVTFFATLQWHWTAVRYSFFEATSYTLFNTWCQKNSAANNYHKKDQINHFQQSRLNLFNSWQALQENKTRGRISFWIRRRAFINPSLLLNIN